MIAPLHTRFGRRVRCLTKKPSAIAEDEEGVPFVGGLINAVLGGSATGALERWPFFLDWSATDFSSTSDRAIANR
jgi:hypothetical protein